MLNGLNCLAWWFRMQLKCERIAIKPFVCYESSDCNRADNSMAAVLGVPRNSPRFGIKLDKRTTTIFWKHIHFVFNIFWSAHIWIFFKLIYLKFHLIFSKCVKFTFWHRWSSDSYIFFCELTCFRHQNIEWCLCISNSYALVISNRSYNRDIIFTGI